MERVQSGLTYLHDYNASSLVDLLSSAASISGSLCMLSRRERPSRENLWDQEAEAAHTESCCPTCLSVDLVIMNGYDHGCSSVSLYA